MSKSHKSLSGDFILLLFFVLVYLNLSDNRTNRSNLEKCINSLFSKFSFIAFIFIFSNLQFITHGNI